MIDRKRMRENLQKRTEASAARGEGDSNQKYLIGTQDELLPLWKARPTKGQPHIIDIIPFIAGDKYPLEGGRRTVHKGDDEYVLNISVHQNVGPLKEMIVCPLKNYGLPCPICEDLDKRSRAGEEWDTLKEISPKDRSVYNVIVMDDAKTEAKGIQIWEVSYRQSEKNILAIARNPRGGGFIPFQSPDQGAGKSIAFDVDDDTYWTPRGHRFVERNYSITDEVLEQAFSLDELVNLLSYDDIKKKYFGADTEGDPGEAAKVHHSDTCDDVKIDNDPPSASRRRRTEEKVVAEDECPFGGKFGEEIDKLNQCSKECPDDKYQACAKRADQIEEEKREAARKESGAPMRRRG